MTDICKYFFRLTRSGDGLRTGTEECDDGNTINGEGCTFYCSIEAGFTCLGGNSSARDTCSFPSKADAGEFCVVLYQSFHVEAA